MTTEKTPALNAAVQNLLNEYGAGSLMAAVINQLKASPLRFDSYNNAVAGLTRVLDQFHTDFQNEFDAGMATVANC